MADHASTSDPAPARQHRVLVVMPTYDEAANITTAVGAVRRCLPDAEIVVVDDGSPDGTADLVAGLASDDPSVHLLRRPGKTGLGDAYRAGFQFGLSHGFDHLVEMDADLSHDATYLPELVSASTMGADLVIGSRYVPGGSVRGWDRRRWWLSRWGNRYAALALGLAVNDCTAGYRVYRASTLRSIRLDEVTADGFVFQIEMTYHVVRAGGRIVEIPIVFADRIAGASKMDRRIVVEALRRVTWWGLRDALNLQRRRRAYRTAIEARRAPAIEASPVSPTPPRRPTPPVSTATPALDDRADASTDPPPR